MSQPHHELSERDISPKWVQHRISLVPRITGKPRGRGFNERTDRFIGVPELGVSLANGVRDVVIREAPLGQPLEDGLGLGCLASRCEIAGQDGLRPSVGWRITLQCAEYLFSGLALPVVVISLTQEIVESARPRDPPYVEAQPDGISETAGIKRRYHALTRRVGKVYGIDPEA